MTDRMTKNGFNPAKALWKRMFAREYPGLEFRDVFPEVIEYIEDYEQSRKRMDAFVENNPRRQGVTMPTGEEYRSQRSEDEYEALETELEVLRDTREALASKIDELDAKYDALVVEAVSLNVKMAGLRLENKRMKDDNVKLIARGSELSLENERLQSELTQVRGTHIWTEAADLKEMLAAKSDELELADGVIELVTAEKNELRAEIRKMQEENEELSDTMNSRARLEIEKLRQINDELEQKLIAVQNENAILDGKSQSVHATNVELCNKTNSLRAKQNELTDEADILREENKRLQVTRDMLQDKLAKADHSTRDILREYNRLLKSVVQIESALEAIGDIHFLLEENEKR